jgi:hypothetical protein
VEGNGEDRMGSEGILTSRAITSEGTVLEGTVLERKGREGKGLDGFLEFHKITMERMGMKRK